MRNLSTQRSPGPYSRPSAARPILASLASVAVVGLGLSLGAGNVPVRAWAGGASGLGAPQGNGLIAFTSNRSGNNDVYAQAVDGTGLADLTTNSASDSQPAWSPDGR